MRRGISIAIITVTIALLVVSIAVQVWFLPTEVRCVVEVFPEVQPIAALAIAWGVLAIVCWQVAGIIGLRVAVHDRTHPSESAHRWLWAMVGCFLAFIVLVVAAFIALDMTIFATPGVMLRLIGGGILAAIAALSLAVCKVNSPYRHFGFDPAIENQHCERVACPLGR